MASIIRRSRLVLQSQVTTKLGRVFLAGYLRNNRGIPLNALRVYGKYALVYLLEGSGRMKVGDLPLIKCRAGDLLFVYPEIPHAYGPGPGEKWSEFYLVFEGPVFDLWRRAGLLQPQRPVIRLPQTRRWLPRLEAIASSDFPETAKGMLQRVASLQEFLADIAEEAESPPQSVPWLDAAMDILVNRLDLTPAAIARSLGLSYETFRKEFARRTGMPPARYRLRRLMDQARLLMAERNMNNKQIAEALGFCDEFHFSRRFRQIIGQSPRKYRRSMKMP